MTERRKELRAPADDLPVRIWGTDTHGIPFLQTVFARNLSMRGALLTGIEQELRPGDLVGVQHGARQARFRIVWIGYYSGKSELIEAAVHRLQGDECPWPEALFQQAR